MDVVAVGWACPLGLRSHLAYAAIRAGLRAIEFDDPGEEDDDDESERRVSKLVEGDPPRAGVGRVERALFFADRALAEVLEQVELDARLEVCLVADEPGSTPSLDLRAGWAALRQRAPGLPDAVGLHGGGRAGVFAALAAAAEALAAGSTRQVLIGGFDSLAAHDAPRSFAHERGRVAGEGAAFVLLSPPGASPHALARVGPAVLARDACSHGSGQPSRGYALTEVYRAVLADRRAPVDVIVSANPSENWWARELSYAYLRNAAGLPEPLRVTSLYQYLGDAGPVSGVAALVAATRLLTPLLPGRQPAHRSALIHASADDGLVGGCCLDALTSSP